jgi:hypothetical protein
MGKLQSALAATTIKTYAPKQKKLERLFQSPSLRELLGIAIASWIATGKDYQVPLLTMR